MGIENIKGIDKAIEINKQSKKKTFKIIWLEHFATIEDYTEIKGYLPITHKYIGHKSGYGEEYECWDFFEAKDIKEAKQKIKEDYYEVEIFTVFDDKGNRLFTEEDL